MTRRPLGERIVLASHNPGKIEEFRYILGEAQMELVPAGDLGLPEPEETGSTFVENALLKARAAAEASKLPAIGDDSGVVIEGLDGQPGIYSARWAGPERDFAVARQRVHDELEKRFGSFAEADRRASFVAVIAVVWPDGEARTFEGRADGLIVWPPRGDLGFGYDPIFMPDDEDRTFAEMSAQEKHAQSHRARALAAFRLALLDPED